MTNAARCFFKKWALRLTSALRHVGVSMPVVARLLAYSPPAPPPPPYIGSEKLYAHITAHATAHVQD